ncbi:hypothetical protein GMMP13_1840018 [Candidatus Magnetomoraceae bacterium gMMP-13]
MLRKTVSIIVLHGTILSKVKFLVCLKINYGIHKIYYRTARNHFKQGKIPGVLKNLIPGLLKSIRT